MIQQVPVHKLLKENAMKFNNLLKELDGMKFMNMKTKQLYEITGYHNSLCVPVALELYNSQAEFEVDKFPYVVLEDFKVETVFAALCKQGLVPVVVIEAQDEAEDTESEEDWLIEYNEGGKAYVSY